ncbi:hypothetical protein Srubr_37270 [Streptomyces rubradiris]|uniref:Uncharacterized protein n=1 Tax=Streptomyces rubradiris TaxID=285531 RepID=A0ABQ3RDF0_STRRR|nr:hypothetical protein Srubr_37270 [Streptomyces rubradiris]
MLGADWYQGTIGTAAVVIGGQLVHAVCRFCTRSCGAGMGPVVVWRRRAHPEPGGLMGP